MIRAMKMMKTKALFLVISIISANTLSLETFGDGLWNVNYTTYAEISSFQFDVLGTSVTNAYGGDAYENNFQISADNSTVMGISLTGATIPAGSGVLTILTLSEIPETIINIIN